MKYNVISSDGHVGLAYLPPELFIENASPGLVGRMPKVVDKGEGPEWWADSRQTVEKNLGRVGDPGPRRKVVCENAGRLYGFL